MRDPEPRRNPAGEPSPYFHSVTLEPSLCVGCTTCIRTCPTEAIRVRKGRARILEGRCVDCGACVRVCPQGAKRVLSDPLSLLREYSYRIALPAPALYGQFPGPLSAERVGRALRALGFDEVVDVAAGALRVTAASRALLEGEGPRPLISSACPAVVRLIQQRFPSLIPQLVPLLPPMEVAARMARERAAEAGHGAEGELGVFFISPCAGKVTMSRSPLGYGETALSGVIAISDIYAPLLAALGRLPPEGEGRDGEESEEGEPAARGIAWSRPGGEIDALGDCEAVAVDGIGEVIALLEALEQGTRGGLAYIEALACPSGCLGGPLTVENPAIARARIRRIERQGRGSGSLRGTRPGVPVPPESLRWTLPLEPRPVQVLDRDIDVAMAMMERMETIASALPGLDCGACGAPGCQALAEDIVRGSARETDCIFKLREEVRDLAGRLLALEELKPPGLDRE